MSDLKENLLTLSPRLSHIAETCLLTFYCHALESQSQDPILQDEKAVQVTRRLNPLLATSESPMLRALSQGRVRPDLIVHIALRAKKFDEYAEAFITQHPDGIIVNIGCGMDSRFERIDNGSLLFFDLDLPEVIELKRHFYTETDRYRMLAVSVFDTGWMDTVQAQGKRPVIFLAEGVFMYLEPHKVKELVLELQARFLGSELVCEMVNQRWLSPMMKKMLRGKLRRAGKIGADANFQFGIPDGRALESWQPHIQLLDEWSYFESNHPKLGWLRIFRHSTLFTRTQWTLHYRLG